MPLNRFFIKDTLQRTLLYKGYKFLAASSVNTCDTFSGDLSNDRIVWQKPEGVSVLDGD